MDRKQRKEEFERWKSGKGASYWTDQRARLSAIRTAGTLIEASEPYAEDSLHRISNVPQGMFYSSISIFLHGRRCGGMKMLIDTLSAPVYVLIVIPTSTPIGSPTLTMQTEPLGSKDLELPLPAFTSPAYASTTLDASNTVGTVPDPVPTISGEGDESLLIDEAERGVLHKLKALAMNASLKAMRVV